MTLPELILWTAHQINDVYHNTEHSGLGCMTPHEAWIRSRTKNGEYVIPPYPDDRDKFLKALLPGVMRMVTREGINRFGFLYWDSSLVPLIGTRVWVAADPRDVSKVYVLCGNSWLTVPWRDRTQPPCALFELERAKKSFRTDNGGRQVSEAKVFAGLSKMREITENAIKTTRAQRRDKAKSPKAVTTGVGGSALDYSVISRPEKDPF